ncbi:6-hydroxy-D-nicotine oxidase [Grifola frondosa]|uniref:6-hydroxy-D-nicotine oxidase n=1 Tax=Grifola frondosa TaxID=5627 RepID=A0A1C7MMH4_GRIFR|nr:6-hydroxy-D-nicotine oxidase [Grifola frondosa]
MNSWSLLLIHVLLACSNAVLVLGGVLRCPESTSGSSSNWLALNDTVGGRLHIAVPFSEPCFSTYEGKFITPNITACSSIEQSYVDPTFRVNYFGAWMMPQWETCQSSAVPEGCLLDSSNPSDPLAFDGVNCQLGNIPPFYIDVQSVADVQAALHFSRRTGVRLSVKNKGHDYKGRSSGKNTLSLWVNNLNSISHDIAFQPEGCSTTYDAITIGGGARLQDVYEFADSINRTFIGGYHQTIGTGGGWFLGGGHSILSPVYGLGVDRVVQVKVVTPDGVYRVANECQNSDLFWALRGGGGSAFGVVMESTHRLEPQLTLQAAVIGFTANSTKAFPWYQLALNNSLAWANDGWGGHLLGSSLIYVTPLLTNDEAVASMKPAADFALAQGGSVVVEELPSWYSFFTKYVTLAQAAVGSELAMGTRLINTTLFSTEEGRQQLSAVLENVLSFASPYIVVATPFLYNYTEGTTSVTPAWRTSLWHACFKLGLRSQFTFNSTLEERTAVYQTVSDHTQTFRDITPGSGAYFNEGDVYEPDHEFSYWGDNYPRLLSIKQQYDPTVCWIAGSVVRAFSLRSFGSTSLISSLQLAGRARTTVCISATSSSEIQLCLFYERRKTHACERVAATVGGG